MTDHSAVRAHLARWYRFMETHDQNALKNILHPEVVFESPVVHTPQRGRDITFRYLASAGYVLGGSCFAYVGVWLNETGAILEFTTEINGFAINGIDMISFDEQGLITHFKVMVRPLKAIQMVHQMMAAQLQAQTVTALQA